MKTKTILLLLLLFSAAISAEVKRVAILEPVDKENKISYSNKLILRASLTQAITNTPGYEVYDRTDIDAIMSEHSFQRTGLVGEEQIKKLGEMTGADYILVAEAVVVDAKNIFVTAKLLDIVTSRTIVTEMMQIDTEHMQTGCVALAKKIFSGKKELNFGEQIPAGPQLVRNSKVDQRLFGVGAYSYGETQMDKKAFEKFMRENSPQAYKKYIRGKACIAAGWTCLTVGILATVGGCVLVEISDDLYRDDYEKCANNLNRSLENTAYNDGYYMTRHEQLPSSNVRDFVSYRYGEPAIPLRSLNSAERAWYNACRTYYDEYRILWNIGFGLAVGGGCLTGVSIPLLGAGYKVRNNAHKNYNVEPKSNRRYTLSLRSNQSGIGLALNF